MRPELENRLLELVHSDICGKINTKSLSGAEYFLTVIDDCTCYVWVYLLKHKSEAFKKICEWKNMISHLLNLSFLKQEGIKHQLTIPKCPEQNGIAERMNRTLLEMVRSMLVDSKLPQKFWGEALSTAVYLRNRYPTRAVPNMTLYETLTGTKPKVGHLLVFGCSAYRHIPKDERQKLDPK